jgi:hypothetical protein
VVQEGDQSDPDERKGLAEEVFMDLLVQEPYHTFGNPFIAPRFPVNIIAKFTPSLSALPYSPSSQAWR